MWCAAVPGICILLRIHLSFNRGKDKQSKLPHHGAFSVGLTALPQQSQGLHLLRGTQTGSHWYVVTPCQLLGTRWAGLKQRGKAEPSQLTWGEK